MHGMCRRRGRGGVAPQASTLSLSLSLSLTLTLNSEQDPNSSPYPPTTNTGGYRHGQARVDRRHRHPDDRPPLVAHLRLRLAYSPTPNLKPTRTASGLRRMEGTLRSRPWCDSLFLSCGFALQSGPALRAECRVSRSYACKRKPRTYNTVIKCCAKAERAG